VAVTRALIVIAFVFVGVPAFFAWAGWEARRHHARFTRRDVQAAFEDALGPSGYFDDWELFLAWPINDPYLESVRQRCIQIWDECGGPGDEFVARLRPIHEELNNRQ
jgi:hypothetical protein